MEEFLSKIKEFERGLSKTHKKVDFIYSFEPSPFNGQSYQKQKGPGTSDSHSSGYEASLQKFLY